VGRSQSGPTRGPVPSSAGHPGPDPDPISETATGPATDPPGLPDDRFDAIIATVDPDRPGWLDTIDWPGLLATDGTLAVITHCDIGGGRLVDPIGPVVAAVRSRGLVYLDHVILLDTPPREIITRTQPGTGAVDTAPGIPGGPSPDTALTSARAHADLLIFASLAAPTVATTDPAESGETPDV